MGPAFGHAGMVLSATAILKDMDDHGVLDTLFHGEEYKDQQYAYSLLWLCACASAVLLGHPLPWGRVQGPTLCRQSHPILRPGFSYAQLYLLNTLFHREDHTGQFYVDIVPLFFTVYSHYDMQELEAP